MLSTNKKDRKERPVASGVLAYFPDAIAEVAHVSYVGNKQHNGPDAPMTWTRNKSTDHADCVARHLIERGTIDDDGLRHSAKVAWRALAMLQIELEAVPTTDQKEREMADKMKAVFGELDIDGSKGSFVPLMYANTGTAAREPAAPNVVPPKPITREQSLSPTNREFWDKFCRIVTTKPTILDGPCTSAVEKIDWTAVESAIASEDYDAAMAADPTAVLTEHYGKPTTPDELQEVLEDALANDEDEDDFDDDDEDDFSDGSATGDFDKAMQEASDIAKSEEVPSYMGCDGSMAGEPDAAIQAAMNDLDRPTYYISGPMRGHKDFNFPAFDAARDRLEAQGINVISPADMDREFDNGEQRCTIEYVVRDVNALVKLAADNPTGKNAIYMLNGWHNSKGARAEIAVAEWLELKIVFQGIPEYPDLLDCSASRD